MSVYVDPAIHPWRGKKWCHLVADTEEELHVFARKLGLKRAWFQAKSELRHYDINESRRVEALRLGAIELSLRQMAEFIRAERAKRNAANAV